jgi:RNA polymerase sigma factor (sigma-70 family)
MPQAHFADAFSDLCRRAAHVPDALPDGELLRRYAEARDEAAFTALLRRHGKLVWGAALRRTSDRQAAEDVFQATFLTLARRAGRLDGRASLAGWLYTVGVRLARRAARRRPVEAIDQAPDPRPGPLADLSARELLTVIDDELGRLPERLRLPVVLCCLDGLSRDEAALRLGCSFQVLKGRLERGRELLRKRLARRGVTLSAALGGLVVVPAAVPPEVSAATMTAVLSGSARPAAAALAKSFGAGRGAGLTALVMAGLLGLGMTLMPGDSPPKPTDKPPVKEPAPAGDTIAVRILRDGKPAPGAQVWVASRQEKDRPPPIVAGADGLARIAKEPGRRIDLDLFARDADGRIGRARVYDQEILAGLSPTVHLLPVGDLTGRLRTTDGQPIAGAELKVQQFDRPDDEHEPARPSYVSIPEWAMGYTVKTDAAGRFRIPGAPVGYRSFVSVKTDGHGQGYLLPEAGKPIDVTLAPAGAVRLGLGGPGDAAATKGLSWYLSGQTPPARGGSGFGGQAAGTFDGSAEVRIPNLAPGKYRLELRSSARNAVRVVAATEVTIESGKTAEVPATVEPMARVTGRFLDARTGKGIPKVKVYLRERTDGRGPGSYDGSTETDAEGRFAAYGPPGAWVEVTMYGSPAGYAMPTEYPKPVKLDVQAPQAFADVKFRKTLNLRGVVVDAAGRPVASPAVRPARLNLRQDGPDVITGKTDGTFTLTDLDPADVVAVRVKHADAVNVPTPVEVGTQDGPVTITVTEKNACRVRGRVTDTAGKPLAGAKVGVTWHYQGLGREASYSTSRGVELLTTDADGRYESGALWPGDHYSVTVRKDEYARGESKQTVGEAGQVHDLGTVALVPTGLSVRGRVVGLDGEPVAGVTVFNRGDGPASMTTTTGPDGTFALTGFFDATGFVLAKKDGYRFTAMPARPGGEAVTVTLRKTTEPPAPVSNFDAHQAALAKFTRALLEMLWADREHLGGFENNVFRAMTRFDPATAAKWRDATKASERAALSRKLADAERERALLPTARADVDEALALIPNGKDRWAVRRLVELGEALLPHDRAKALRVAEEAAVRARGLDPLDRAWLLAQAGSLAAGAGNSDGGQKLVVEAADLIGKLPADERHSYYRGHVAGALAAFDEPAALKLAEPIADPDTYNRALGHIIDRLARTDPKRAEALFGKFRPGRGFAHCEARLWVGLRLVASDPDRAVIVVEGIPEARYRVLGLARLATSVKDRARAWELIDRAMAEIEQKPTEFQSWSNSGGAAAAAGLICAWAREVGHPDLAALVGRAVALRSPVRTWTSPDERHQELVSLASMLAFADPATARAVLAGIAPPAGFARRAPGERRDWLFAAALADPAGAKAVVDAIWSAAKARRAGGEAVSNTGLIELTSILTDPDGRLAVLAQYASVPSVPDAPE